MDRIKVTGYVRVEDLEPAHLDPAHPSGLSSAGYDLVLNEYPVSLLEDVEMWAEDA